MKRKAALLFLVTALIFTSCGGGTAEITDSKTGEESVVNVQSESTQTASGSEGEISLPEEAANADSQEGQEESSDWTEPEIITVGISGSEPGSFYEGEEFGYVWCPALTVLDEGYEALEKELTEVNQQRRDALHKICEENKESVRELIDDGLIVSGSVSSSITVQRSDERILSFLDETYANLGGTHPSSFVSGYNLDVSGEKILTLKDVLADYDGFADYVQSKVPEIYEEEELFDDYGTVVHDLFYPENQEAETIPWTMDREGITVYFNTYVLAPYASGNRKVHVSFDENRELFRPEYLCDTSHFARRLDRDASVTEDLNGDGTKESFSFQAEDLYEEYSTRFTVTIGDQSVTETIPGWYVESYLVRRADGHCYLYSELSGDNDYRNLYVFDLGGTSPVLLQENEEEVSFYGYLMADPEKFVLGQRVYMLGTYMGYRSYSVGEDGLPHPMEDSIKLLTDTEEGERSLKSIREMKVWIVEDGEETKEEVLPAGTVFYPRRSDDSSYLETELEDGRFCRIYVEVDEVGLRYIDGVDEREYFEDLPYAG
ncbi:MAG: RsiV family protein [Fusicatenibacter sp.]|nr:RsiV family protein [Fusicatenibacter sp.]